MRETADVAIVGAGIVGMSSAYELARRGAGRVVVLEKNSPATGTTGGSAGVICPVDLGEIYALMNLAGYARIKQLERDSGLGFHGWGNLNPIYEPAPFPPGPDPYAQRFGGDDPRGIYANEILEAGEMLRRFPWISAESRDGRRLLGGVWYRNQGFINPYELVSVYERLAARVEVRRNTPVLEMRRSGDRIQTLVTRRGPIDVGLVLNAGGPWGAKVAAMASSSVRVIPQRIQVCVATAFDDGVGEAPLTGVPERVQGHGVWSRGEVGGTLLFGQHHHTSLPGVTDDPDFVNRINDPDYPDAVAKVYRRWWNLPNSRFLNGWCCVYGTTEDGYPVLSRDTEVSNLYHALGMNGHGIIMHAAVSMAMTRLMLDGSTSVDLGPEAGHPETLDIGRLDMDRFSRGELLTFDLKVDDLKPR
ncbi:MAG: FAD-binding oxidoreductase [Acidimicrobiaceae bacterium]|nr:FAD-binding oxidoreductase [Acidimicrobiaceae bacterium]